MQLVRKAKVKVVERWMKIPDRARGDWDSTGRKQTDCTDLPKTRRLFITLTKVEHGRRFSVNQQAFSDRSLFLWGLVNPSWPRWHDACGARQTHWASVKTEGRLAEKHRGCEVKTTSASLKSGEKRQSEKNKYHAWWWCSSLKKKRNEKQLWF